MNKKYKYQTGGYTLPTFEVTAQLPKWAKYDRDFKALLPKEEILKNYLTPFSRALGNSETIHPDYIDRDYEKNRNDYIARALILDRNNSKFTDRERQIINSSNYRGVSKEDAYYNPSKIPISTGNQIHDFLYDNSYLLKTPGIRQIIQGALSLNLNDGDVANGVRDNKASGSSDRAYSDSKFNPLTQFLFNNQGATKSPYKPKNDYYQFLNSYSLKNVAGVSPNINEALAELANPQVLDSIKKSPIFFENGKYNESTYYNDNVNLGDFKAGVAYDSDKNLPYYFMSDAWDFDPQGYASKYNSSAGTNTSPKDKRQAYQQAFLLQTAGNPYKIYDRFYFNPTTGEYIDDSKLDKKRKGGMINKYQTGGFMNFLNKFSKAGNMTEATQTDYDLNGLNTFISAIAQGKLNGENNAYQNYWQRQMSLPSQIVNPQAFGNPYAMQMGGMLDPSQHIKFKGPGFKFKGTYGNFMNMMNPAMASEPFYGWTGDDFDRLGFPQDQSLFKSGGIHIKEANKGKFTKWAKSHGMSVSEAANKVMSAPDGKYSSSVRKMANFAKNAKKFKHEDGGEICWECMQDYSNPLMYPNFPEMRVGGSLVTGNKRLDQMVIRLMQKGGVTANSKADKQAGYYKYPNASSITFPGQGDRTFVPGPFPLLVQDANGIQMLHDQPIQTRGRVIEYPMFQVGGEVNYTAKPVDTEDATIEAEKGEYILGLGTPKNPFDENDSDIGVGLYKVGGNKHYNGGTKLAANPGDFIFSDDRRLAFPKDTAKDLVGKEINKTKLRTPAKLVDKYNKLNQFINMAQDNKTTSIDRKTAMLNTENILDKLADIAIGQEAMKGFPTGIPEFAQASLDKRSAGSTMNNPTSQQPQQMDGMQSFQMGGRSGGYASPRNKPDAVYYIPGSGVNNDYYPMQLPNGFRYQNIMNPAGISPTGEDILNTIRPKEPTPFTANTGELVYTPSTGANFTSTPFVFNSGRDFWGGRRLPVTVMQAPNGFYNKAQQQPSSYWWDMFGKYGAQPADQATNGTMAPWWDQYALKPTTYPELERGWSAPSPVNTTSDSTNVTTTNSTASSSFVPNRVSFDAIGNPDDVTSPFRTPNVPVVTPNGSNARTLGQYYNQQDPTISSRNYNNTVNPNIAELYGFIAANKRYASRYPTAQRNFELDNVDSLLSSSYSPLSASPYLNNIQRQLNTFTANNSGYGPTSYARNAYAFTQALNSQQQAIGQVEQQNIQRQDQLSQLLAQNAANKGQSRLQLQDKYLRELEQVKFNEENASKARMAQNAQLLNSYVNRAYSQKYANAMLDNFQIDANGNIVPIQGRSLKQAVLDSPAGNQMSSQLNYMEQLFRLMNRYGIRNGNFVDDFIKPITGAK